MKGKRGEVDPLNPTSDQPLISSYSNTTQAFKKIMIVKRNHEPKKF